MKEGSKHSAKAKLEMRLAKLGKKHTKEWNANIVRSLEGRPCLPATREKIGRSRLGEKHWNWKGGKVKRRKYVMILSPDHPACTKSGYVLEHRIVVEKIIGRFLKGTEEVHHVDRDRGNNLPWNLMAFKSRAAHVAFGIWGRPPQPGDIIFDGRLLKH
jgi:hypothetical protein